MLSAVTVKQFKFCFPDFLINQEPHFFISNCHISHLGRKAGQLLYLHTQWQQLLIHQLLNVLLRKVLISVPLTEAGEDQYDGIHARKSVLVLFIIHLHAS